MIQIIDNCIPVEQQNDLENHLTSLNFPWFYCDSKQYGNEIPEPSPYEKALEHFKGVVDTPQMIHLMYTENGDYSDIFPKLAGLISAPTKNGESIERIIRIKANLTWPSNTRGTTSIPHIDYQGDEDFMTAIYYVNESDGDTVIYDKRFGEDISDMRVLQKISPRKGRMVLFDGKLLHAGTNPTQYRPRILINYNFIQHQANKVEIIKEEIK